MNNEAENSAANHATEFNDESATAATDAIVARNPKAFRIKKKAALAINKAEIPMVPLQEQSDELRNLSATLGVNVFDSNEIEQNVIAQVDRAIEEQNQEEDEARLRRLQHNIRAIRSQLRDAKIRLQTESPESVRSDLNNLSKKLTDLRASEEAVEKRIKKRQQVQSVTEAERRETEIVGATVSKDNERERLIRAGKLTPFDKLEGMERRVQVPPHLGEQEDRLFRALERRRSSNNQQSTKKPDQVSTAPVIVDVVKPSTPQKRQTQRKKEVEKPTHSPIATTIGKNGQNGRGRGRGRQAKGKEKTTTEHEEDVNCICGAKTETDETRFMIECQQCKTWQHGSCVGITEFSIPPNYICPDCQELNAGGQVNQSWVRRSKRTAAVAFARERPAKQVVVEEEEKEEGEAEEDLPEADDQPFHRGSSSEEDDVLHDDVILPASLPHLHRKRSKSDQHLDDITSHDFEERARAWALQHYQHRKAIANDDADDVDDDFDWKIEEYQPCLDDIQFEGGFRLPSQTYNLLFEYQRTGVRWLWELHCQNAGGIVGDEMGLGKTIQTISFLGGIRYSGLATHPSLIVCPATLLRQWRREFQKWWPPVRVGIVHKSSMAATSTVKQTFDVIHKEGGVIITTYESLKLYQDRFLDLTWQYVFLDEGHKIKNPDADITIVCKRFNTPHRIILSGSPIQNNLTELWSLFDFVFPGKLGTLPVFQNQFEKPIQMSSYANASEIQLQTGFKCASMLRDVMNPYLLRRIKADVAQDLPKKNEQVLFCRLTAYQRRAYKHFLKSAEAEQILQGNRHALYGIDILRKICNHPDLLAREEESKNEDYGDPEKAGKLQVISALLPMWHSQGHRALIFCQTKQMLDIVEKHIKKQEYTYLRMDGSTPVGARLRTIDEFNTNSSIYLFLLTTRVGGLGVNLTGANRVVIFDPDWNPSTDMQARERAWRLGQTKDVTVYRLMTVGTIEEKIYHRQIFKQFLTNKILTDPKQRRFFKSNDLKELFSLDEETNTTETGDLFAGMNAEQTAADVYHGRRFVDHTETLDATTGDVDATGPNDDDADILQGLFRKVGIHSALKHDIIMGEAGSRAETSLVEREASRVAAEAAAALRASRALIKQHDVSVPTWTGRSGMAGLNTPESGSSSKPRFGARANPRLSQSDATMTSSSEILKKIRERGMTARSEQELGDDTMADDPRTRLIARLVEFISSHDNQVTSQQVVSKFQDEIAGDLVPVFRQMLRQVATLVDKHEGIWQLKSEYH